jgi:hypothetical protein
MPLGRGRHWTLPDVGHGMLELDASEPELGERPPGDNLDTSLPIPRRRCQGLPGGRAVRGVGTVVPVAAPPGVSTGKRPYRAGRVPRPVGARQERRPNRRPAGALAALTRCSSTSRRSPSADQPHRQAGDRTADPPCHCPQARLNSSPRPTIKNSAKPASKVCRAAMPRPPRSAVIYERRVASRWPKTTWTMPGRCITAAVLASDLIEPAMNERRRS